MASWVRAHPGRDSAGIPNLNIPGMDVGSQPFPIWKVRQIEATRFAYLPGSAFKMALPLYVEDTPAGPAMNVFEDNPQAAVYEKEFEHFAAVFPG